MEFLGIIPARYGSTRLEGKPLVDIKGKPMIQWVYEKAKLALKHLVVATDDDRIMAVVKGFGGEVVMTSETHNTGTNRCLEALQSASEIYAMNFDVVINIQGDEPMLHPDQVKTIIHCFDDPEAELATLVTPVTNPTELDNESEVFVTFDKNMKALYFSRAVIPVVYGIERKEWMDYATYHKHVGLYGYTPSALAKFSSLPQSTLEKLENLEQNRWLEDGGNINIGITEHQSANVDTIQDLERIRKII